MRLVIEDNGVKSDRKAVMVKMFHDAFTYACKRYGIEGSAWTVNLSFVPTWAMPNPDASGATRNLDCDDGSHVIEMKLSPHAFDSGELPLMETFFHELWHVRQIVRGDLRADMPSRSIIWHGKIYGPKALESFSQSTDWNATANDAPWEQEAYLTADYMPTDFFKSRGKPESWFRKWRTKPTVESVLAGAH